MVHRSRASRLGFLIAVFALWFLAIQPASATVTYQYTGSTYDVSVIGDLNGRIEGTLTFESPLPSNSPMVDVSDLVVAYAFTDGVHPYIGPRFADTAVFRVETDAGGSIVGWEMSLIRALNVPYHLAITNPSRGPGQFVPELFDHVLFEDDEGFPWVGAESGAPGTWTFFVPEPSVLTLFGLGMGALAIVTRRR